MTSGPGWRHESLNSHGITIYLIMNKGLLILNKDMLLFPSVRVNQIGSQLLGHKNALWEAACFSNFKEHDSPENVIITRTGDRNREGSVRGRGSQNEHFFFFQKYPWPYPSWRSEISEILLGSKSLVQSLNDFRVAPSMGVATVAMKAFEALDSSVLSLVTPKR